MNNKFTKYISLSSLFSDTTIQDKLISLGNSIELPALFSRLGFRVISAVFPGRVKLASRLKLLMSFARFLIKMNKNHGSLTVAKYLKASQLSLQRFIAGSGVRSLRELEPELPLSRMVNGLPQVIPTFDRSAIRQGSQSTIRLWNTIFALYKVLDAPAVLKISTITTPFQGDLTKLGEVRQMLGSLALQLKNRHSIEWNHEDPRLLWLETASSTSRVAWIGFIHDVDLIHRTGLEKLLLSYFEAAGYQRLPIMYEGLLLAIKRGWISYTKVVEGVKPKIIDFFVTGTSTETEFGAGNVSEEPKSLLEDGTIRTTRPVAPLGRLSVKKEAAGKARVFAMVDVWTQSALKPLHEQLFDILRLLPNDATFDQHASVERCFTKCKMSGQSYGYDLSAATDRLPILLQEEVLSVLFGEKLASAWSHLLIDRTYYLRSAPEEFEGYSYAVGQPMGAYSSWAMLALTHHLLVQAAAKRVYPTVKWFENYELLGDDVVIFDKEVAERYLDVMSCTGVDINLSKSVISNIDCFEFAKVTGYKGNNVSPISWKMFIQQNSLMGRASILYYLITRLHLPRPIRYINNIMRKSRWTLGEPVFGKIALLTMLGKRSGAKMIDLLSIIVDPAHPLRHVFREPLLNKGHSLSTYLGQLVLGQAIVPSQLFKQREFFELPWQKLALWKRFFVKWFRFDVEFTASNMTDRLFKEQFVIPVPISEINTFNIRDTKLHYDLQTFYLSMQSRFSLEMAIMADFLIEKGDKQSLDLPLEDLIRLNEDWDRIYEFTNIFDRAWNKLEDSPRIKLLDSPLKLVRFLKTVWKDRPSWTFRFDDTDFLRWYPPRFYPPKRCTALIPYLFQLPSPGIQYKVYPTVDKMPGPKVYDLYNIYSRTILSKFWFCWTHYYWLDMPDSLFRLIPWGLIGIQYIHLLIAEFELLPSLLGHDNQSTVPSLPPDKPSPGSDPLDTDWTTIAIFVSAIVIMHVVVWAFQAPGPDPHLIPLLLGTDYDYPLSVSRAITYAEPKISIDLIARSPEIAHGWGQECRGQDLFGP
jgi:hypothetical protein